MKKTIDHLYWPFIVYLFAVVVIFTIQYLYIMFSPMSKRVTYFAVEPAQIQNKIWEEFYMVSDREVKQEVEMEWNDVMYCTKELWTHRFWSTLSRGVAQEHERKQLVWRYEWNLPTKETDCYMVSTITTIHEYWLRKKQQVTTWPFYFVK